MEKNIIDFILVPLGLLIMIVYHVWLLRMIKNKPNKTAIGISAINRRIWVSAMMEDPANNGILSIETLRNQIMTSTVLASTAIMLSFFMAVMMKNGGIYANSLVLLGDKSKPGLSIKFFSILVFFLLAFLFSVQSIRFYNEASLLINVPLKKIASHPRQQELAFEYVVSTVNRGSYFWSLGLRAFYFSFTLLLWIFGPIPLFLFCLAMVPMLYFLDIAFAGVCHEGNE